MTDAIPLLLLGAGGHARSCIDVVERDARFRVRGLIGHRDEVGSLVAGYPVLGTDDDLPAMVAAGDAALVTVGQIRSPAARMSLFARVLECGASAPVVVSPRAYVSPRARIGAGTIVLHGAVVNAGAVIGRNCIVNSLALIEHDAEVGDHCHVSTGAIVNGGARIGSGTFVGSGAVVRQDVTIGTRCVIAMGAVVAADCPDGVTLRTARGSS